MSLDQLDREFAQFARQRAEKIAPGATWEEVELPPDANSTAVAAWLEKHPQSFEGLRASGSAAGRRAAVAEGRGKCSKSSRASIRITSGRITLICLLAIVFRQLSDPAAEHKVLEELAMRDGDAITAYLRLIELVRRPATGRASPRMRAAFWRSIRWCRPRTASSGRAPPNNWASVTRLWRPYRALALLDDTDPAEVHYQIAKLLRDAGKPQEARREVFDRSRKHRASARPTSSCSSWSTRSPPTNASVQRFLSAEARTP